MSRCVCEICLFVWVSEEYFTPKQRAIGRAVAFLTTIVLIVPLRVLQVRCRCLTIELSMLLFLTRVWFVPGAARGRILSIA